MNYRTDPYLINIGRHKAILHVPDVSREGGDTNFS